MFRAPLSLLVASAVASAVCLSRAEAQIAPRQARVEITSPEPPIPVTIAGQRVLAYELHVTNFGSGALGLREIDVRSTNAALPFVSYRDSSLRELLAAPGGMSGGATRLDQGQQSIVFLWLVNPPTESGVLLHRLVFDNLDSAQAQRDGGPQEALDSVRVPISVQKPIRIRFPLPSGIWFAGTGPSNTSSHRRSLAAVDGHAFLSQRFAIDWQLIGANGNSFQGDDHKNESYWGFGQPVLAVADGEVVEAVDSIDDHAAHGPIPHVTLANILGNHVTLKIGPDRYATYAHLRHHSVKVHAGERVKVGAPLAEVGMTGQTTGPHLHLQITDRPSSSGLGAEGVPFVFATFQDYGPGSEFELTKHPDLRRQNELPADGAVIRIP